MRFWFQDGFERLDRLNVWRVRMRGYAGIFVLAGWVASYRLPAPLPLPVMSGGDDVGGNGTGTVVSTAASLAVEAERVGAMYVSLLLIPASVSVPGIKKIKILPKHTLTDPPPPPPEPAPAPAPPRP